MNACSLSHKLCSPGPDTLEILSSGFSPAPTSTCLLIHPSEHDIFPPPLPPAGLCWDGVDIFTKELKPVVYKKIRKFQVAQMH